MSQPLNVTFVKGSQNTITIGGYNGGESTLWASTRICVLKFC